MKKFLFLVTTAIFNAILKGTHTKIIPARLGLIWISGFRGEDLNVKVNDRRRTDKKGHQVMAKAHMAYSYIPK